MRSYKVKSYYIVFDISHKKTEGYHDTLYFESENCEDILHHFNGFLKGRDYNNIRLFRFTTKKEYEESYQRWFKELKV